MKDKVVRDMSCRDSGVRERERERERERVRERDKTGKGNDYIMRKQGNTKSRLKG